MNSASVEVYTRITRVSWGDSANTMARGKAEREAPKMNQWNATDRKLDKEDDLSEDPFWGFRRH